MFSRLLPFFVRAIDGTRTRDLRLGKATYYQLYHYRIYVSESLTQLI